MSKPSLFVGSSSEGLDFARAVRTGLAADVEVTIWNEGVFALGQTFIEALVNALPRFDFAVLVLTPDDFVVSRDTEALGPRDNVLFELGLFMGHLGRSRTFVLHPVATGLKIPTDLAGIVTAGYEWPRSDNNHRAALGAACDGIRQAIRDLGIIDKKTSRAIGRSGLARNFRGRSCRGNKPRFARCRSHCKALSPSTNSTSSLGSNEPNHSCATTRRTSTTSSNVFAQWASCETTKGPAWVRSNASTRIETNGLIEAVFLHHSKRCRIPQAPQ